MASSTSGGRLGGVTTRDVFETMQRVPLSFVLPAIQDRVFLAREEILRRVHRMHHQTTDLRKLGSLVLNQHYGGELSNETQENGNPAEAGDESNLETSSMFVTETPLDAQNEILSRLSTSQNQIHADLVKIERGVEPILHSLVDDIIEVYQQLYDDYYGTNEHALELNRRFTPLSIDQKSDLVMVQKQNAQLRNELLQRSQTLAGVEKARKAMIAQMQRQKKEQDKLRKMLYAELARLKSVLKKYGISTDGVSDYVDWDSFPETDVMQEVQSEEEQERRLELIDQQLQQQMDLLEKRLERERQLREEETNMLKVEIQRSIRIERERALEQLNLEKQQHKEYIEHLNEEHLRELEAIGVELEETESREQHTIIELEELRHQMLSISEEHAKRIKEIRTEYIVEIDRLKHNLEDSKQELQENQESFENLQKTKDAEIKKFRGLLASVQEEHENVSTQLLQARATIEALQSEMKKIREDSEATISQLQTEKMAAELRRNDVSNQSSLTNISISSRMDFPTEADELATLLSLWEEYRRRVLRDILRIDNNDDLHSLVSSRCGGSGFSSIEDLHLSDREMPSTSIETSLRPPPSQRNYPLATVSRKPGKQAKFADEYPTSSSSLGTTSEEQNSATTAETNRDPIPRLPMEGTNDGGREFDDVQTCGSARSRESRGAPSPDLLRSASDLSTIIQLRKGKNVSEKGVSDDISSENMETHPCADQQSRSPSPSSSHKSFHSTRSSSTSPGRIRTSKSIGPRRGSRASLASLGETSQSPMGRKKGDKNVRERKLSSISDAESKDSTPSKLSEEDEIFMSQREAWSRNGTFSFSAPVACTPDTLFEALISPELRLLRDDYESRLGGIVEEKKTLEEQVLHLQFKLGEMRSKFSEHSKSEESIRRELEVYQSRCEALEHERILKDMSSPEMISASTNTELSWAALLKSAGVVSSSKEQMQHLISRAEASHEVLQSRGLLVPNSKNNPIEPFLESMLETSTSTSELSELSRVQLKDEMNQTSFILNKGSASSPKMVSESTSTTKDSLSSHSKNEIKSLSIDSLPETELMDPESDHLHLSSMSSHSLFESHSSRNSMDLKSKESSFSRAKNEESHHASLSSDSGSLADSSQSHASKESQSLHDSFLLKISRLESLESNLLKEKEEIALKLSASQERNIELERLITELRAELELSLCALAKQDRFNWKSEEKILTSLALRVGDIETALTSLSVEMERIKLQEKGADNSQIHSAREQMIQSRQRQVDFAQDLLARRRLWDHLSDLSRRSDLISRTLHTMLTDPSTWDESYIQNSLTADRIPIGDKVPMEDRPSSAPLSGTQELSVPSSFTVEADERPVSAGVVGYGIDVGRTITDDAKISDDKNRPFSGSSQRNETSPTKNSISPLRKRDLSASLLSPPKIHSRGSEGRSATTPISSSWISDDRFSETAGSTSGDHGSRRVRLLPGLAPSSPLASQSRNIQISSPGDLLKYLEDYGIYVHRDDTTGRIFLSDERSSLLQANFGRVSPIQRNTKSPRLQFDTDADRRMYYAHPPKIKASMGGKMQSTELSQDSTSDESIQIARSIQPRPRSALSISGSHVPDSGIDPDTLTSNPSPLNKGSDSSQPVPLHSTSSLFSHVSPTPERTSKTFDDYELQENSVYQRIVRSPHLSIGIRPPSGKSRSVGGQTCPRPKPSFSPVLVRKDPLEDDSSLGLAEIRIEATGSPLRTSPDLSVDLSSQGPRRFHHPTPVVRRDARSASPPTRSTVEPQKANVFYDVDLPHSENSDSFALREYVRDPLFSSITRSTRLRGKNINRRLPELSGSKEDSLDRKKGKMEVEFPLLDDTGRSVSPLREGRNFLPGSDRISDHIRQSLTPPRSGQRRTTRDESVFRGKALDDSIVFSGITGEPSVISGGSPAVRVRNAEDIPSKSVKLSREYPRTSIKLGGWKSAANVDEYHVRTMQHRSPSAPRETISPFDGSANESRKVEHETMFGHLPDAIDFVPMTSSSSSEEISPTPLSVFPSLTDHSQTTFAKFVASSRALR